MKEKNALAERLKTAESARKRFDEDIKRYATESITREEIRQSLEEEFAGSRKQWDKLRVDSGRKRSKSCAVKRT